MLNNVTCYTFAPIALMSQNHYDVNPSMISVLTTLYFATFIPCASIGAWIVETKGLRFGVVLGAFLQSLGCWIRYCADFNGMGFNLVIAGQLVASLGQPFFVNCPPLVASQWFGEKERTLATTIAVNANSLGIAVAYALAPWLVHDQNSIPFYVMVIACTASVSCVVTFFSFADKPPTPPSLTFMDAEEDPSPIAHLRKMASLLKSGPFLFALLAFSMAECVTNAMSVFMDEILTPEGYSLEAVGAFGSLFILSCLLGSAVIGYVVDKLRLKTMGAIYKTSMSLCLCFVFLSMVYFTVTISSQNPSAEFLLSALLLVGFFLGPVQPICLELAVEVTYPSPETTSAGLQQLLGNIFSVLIVPILNSCRDEETGSMKNACMFIAGICLVTHIVFVFFKGRYIRLELEEEAKQNQLVSET
eukprot:GILI01017965.1.p1 GENE.GILI01017965.1~~GILI01017965.1.p1  ORF type:complete len:482 (+),score=98.89 GILI01017965.1:198-1448(+)